MANILLLKNYTDNRGSLNVIEKNLPFEIKRVYYIYNVDNSVRGNHRHKHTMQAAICVKGSCIIDTNNGSEKNSFMLDNPNKCLLLYPEDFHSMYNFTNDAVLLVLASEYYNPNDYIYEKY
jgi:dTDP-4-dehydrorhamnose 3,5-epimerase-like enzyme